MSHRTYALENTLTNRNKRQDAGKTTASCTVLMTVRLKGHITEA